MQPGRPAEPILFMGDSITFGWSGLLSRPGLINGGVPLETTGQMLARLRPQAEQTGARGVHILGGVNDIAGNGGDIPLDRTRANLAAMAQQALAMGLQVWLASVLPVSGIFWNPAVRKPHRPILRLNAWLRRDAEALGVAFIDYHSLLADRTGRLRPAFGADGVHLSEAGYARITPFALKALAVAPRVDSD